MVPNFNFHILYHPKESTLSLTVSEHRILTALQVRSDFNLRPVLD